VQCERRQDCPNANDTCDNGKCVPN
jgi:hypothetical protein